MSNDFQLGPWVVRPSLSIVCSNGTTVRLEPKVMDVLVCLAGHAGQPVSKEELLQTVWPGTFVTDDVLKHCISDLRRAFKDDAREPHVIQTIPKRGYRLLAPVVVVNETERSPSGQPQVLGNGNELTRNRRRLALWIVAIGSAALLGLLLIASTGRQGRGRVAETSNAPPIRSLAVLPLQNLSTDPDQEYFSEGITDALITDLAQIGSLRVISRTSSMQYKDTRKSLPDIARELNVDAIVEGTVQRSGNRVRMTAQLINGRSDQHLWAATYDREIGDALALERDLTEEIARQVQAHTTTAHQSPVAPHRPLANNALDAYLKGNYHMHRFSRGSGDDELKFASDYFQQAIDVDPNFALAYVGIARARLNTMRSSREDLEQARKAAQNAVDLDPTLSDAWATLADLRVDSWDWAQAEEDYRKAVTLNPNSVYAHEWLGDLLDLTGRMEEGWKEFQIAQQLDPNQEHLFFPLYKRHQYDRGIEHLLSMLRNDPNSGYLHHELFEAYTAKGMYKDAVQQLEIAVTLFGYPEVAVKLRRAYAASGYHGALRVYTGALEHLYAEHLVFMPINLAAAYAALGDKERALNWLELGVKNRGRATAGVSVTELRVYPGLEALHSDPRFKDLVRRMGLPP